MLLQDRVTYRNDPFFIFYDSRSGSTLLARLLTEHFGVVIPPEANFLPKVLTRLLGVRPSSRRRKFLQILEKDSKFADWGVDLTSLSLDLGNRGAYSRRAMLDCLMDNVMARKGADAGRTLFGFKKGNYQYYARDIRRVFPGAVFICLVRDGRAVFNSKKRTFYSGSGRPMAQSPEEAAQEWTRCIDNFERLRSLSPSRVLILRYEDLVGDTENTLRAVGMALGAIPAANSKKVMDYQVPGRYGSMHRNVHLAPLASRIEGWRKELDIEARRHFEAIAGDHLSRYSYPLELN